MKQQFIDTATVTPTQKTECEGRTGEYWPLVVAVRTSQSSVSKLFIIWHSASDSKMHFWWFALKGLPPWHILDDVSNLRQKQTTTCSKNKFIDVKSS